MSLQHFYQISSHMSKLVYIFGHVLNVYTLAKADNTIHHCVFSVNFTLTWRQIRLDRFWKLYKGLKSCIFQNMIFYEQRRVLLYKATLNFSAEFSRQN